MLGFLKADKTKQKKCGKLKHLVFLETTVNIGWGEAENQVK
jgi:hypothetical protein